MWACVFSCFSLGPTTRKSCNGLFSVTATTVCFCGILAKFPTSPSFTVLDRGLRSQRHMLIQRGRMNMTRFDPMVSDVDPSWPILIKIWAVRVQKTSNIAIQWQSENCYQPVIMVAYFVFLIQNLCRNLCSQGRAASLCPVAQDSGCRFSKLRVSSVAISVHCFAPFKFHDLNMLKSIDHHYSQIFWDALFLI